MIEFETEYAILKDLITAFIEDETVETGMLLTLNNMREAYLIEKQATHVLAQNVSKILKERRDVEESLKEKEELLKKWQMIG